TFKLRAMGDWRPDWRQFEIRPWLIERAAKHNIHGHSVVEALVRVCDEAFGAFGFLVLCFQEIELRGLSGGNSAFKRQEDGVQPLEILTANGDEMVVYCGLQNVLGEFDSPKLKLIFG